MQSTIYHEIQKPLKSQTPRKERSFLNKGELLEISYGTLTGYNPLLCFTFTSSGVRGVSSIETIEFEAMRHAQKAKKTYGSTLCTTPKNYQKNIFFGRFFLLILEGGTPWGSEFSLKMMRKYCKYRCLMHLEGLKP